MSRVLIILLSSLLTGCAQLGYYGQAINGHLWVMQERRPVAEVLADPASGLSEEEHRLLAMTPAMREFAITELALPDNDSYRQFSDLGRPYVVINLVATPALSVVPKQWCHPVVGCLPYLGYFSKQRVLAERDALREQGMDTYLGLVPAYSSLGWFDDPLLNTMLRWEEADLAGLIFHELTHQRIYFPNDTEFNESLAMVVEREGVRRWLKAHAREKDYTEWMQRKAARTEVLRILTKLREELESLYAGERSETDKRVGKVQLMDRARSQYRDLKVSWSRKGESLEFDGWFDDRLNNAFLALLNTYGEQVPALEKMLARYGGDFQSFFTELDRWRDLSPEQRRARLSSIPER